jgi:hypothetical protein
MNNYLFDKKKGKLFFTVFFSRAKKSSFITLVPINFILCIAHACRPFEHFSHGDLNMMYIHDVQPKWSSGWCKTVRKLVVGAFEDEDEEERDVKS